MAPLPLSVRPRAFESDATGHGRPGERGAGRHPALVWPFGVQVNAANSMAFALTLRASDDDLHRITAFTGPRSRVHSMSVRRPHVSAAPGVFEGDASWLGRPGECGAGRRPALVWPFGVRANAGIEWRSR
jgi:hypothetical protein